MSNKPMLALEEWQLLGGGDAELVRTIQAGEGVLAAAGIPRVLSDRQSIACDSAAEDFRNVVQGTAVSVAGTNGQLFEHIVGAELGLQSVVIRVTAVVAL